MRTKKQTEPGGIPGPAQGIQSPDSETSPEHGTPLEDAQRLQAQEIKRRALARWENEGGAPPDLQPSG